MGRRGRHKKVTKIYKDIFGNKTVETRWVSEGSGCGPLIVIGILLFLFLKGCG